MKGENKMTRQRGLSAVFKKQLDDGALLNPLLCRVRRDTALDLEIRENYLNVYYRGGSMLRVTPVARSPGKYKFFFNTNYASKAVVKKLNLPGSMVDSIAAVESWLDFVPNLKDTMDLWFGKHAKDERALQQMVVWENNDSPWAGGTDYFIVDVEYDDRHGARFDMVALRWESTASARKLQKGYQPRLAIIEMKAGDGALKGGSGLQEHLNQYLKLVGDEKRLKAFKREMVDVFRQKRDLKLIKGLLKNSNQVVKLDRSVELIFLLAGHDPQSRKLSTILKQFQQDGLPGDLESSVRFCTANFTGFGLYGENIHPLSDFMTRFGEQIGR
jgi:hypothetical protein